MNLASQTSRRHSIPAYLLAELALVVELLAVLDVVPAIEVEELTAAAVLEAAAPAGEHLQSGAQTQTTFCVTVNTIC